MIIYTTGNLFESEAEALVNTVNTVGVMGKGLALQFKNLYPENFKRYAAACKKNQVKIGELFVTEEESLLHGKKLIVNFPTKAHWKNPSEYQYIESGLVALRLLIEVRGIKSIAIPPLGAGNGGLDWPHVKALIGKYLNDLDCRIIIYEPSAQVDKAFDTSKVKLSPARAMLLATLFDLVRNEEFVSEFAAEKLTYFLQRFGGAHVFNLSFEPKFYGPYSGKVRHVLHYLSGSYIGGYQDKNTKPFEILNLNMSGEKEVIAYLEQPENRQHKEVVEKTKDFLAGFYSNFALEILSTIDFIMVKKGVDTKEEITQHLWSDRKKALFNNPRLIDIALENLRKHLGEGA